MANYVSEDKTLTNKLMWISIHLKSQLKMIDNIFKPRNSRLETSSDTIQQILLCAVYA